jgi:hypothetical protein
VLDDGEVTAAQVQGNAADCGNKVCRQRVEREERYSKRQAAGQKRWREGQARRGVDAEVAAAGLR